MGRYWAGMDCRPCVDHWRGEEEDRREADAGAESSAKWSAGPASERLSTTSFRRPSGRLFARLGHHDDSGGVGTRSLPAML